MLKKVSFIVIAAFGMMISSASLLSASIDYKTEIAQSEGVSHQVVIQVCLTLENQGIASAEQALDWYKTGEMTITKIETDVYAVTTPGGGLDILVIDGF